LEGFLYRICYGQFSFEIACPTRKPRTCESTFFPKIFQMTVVFVPSRRILLALSFVKYDSGTNQQSNRKAQAGCWKECVHLSKGFIPETYLSDLSTMTSSRMSSKEFCTCDMHARNPLNSLAQRVNASFLARTNLSPVIVSARESSRACQVRHDLPVLGRTAILRTACISLLLLPVLLDRSAGAADLPASMVPSDFPCLRTAFKGLMTVYVYHNVWGRELFPNF
jgi:hypothetical protein